MRTSMTNPIKTTVEIEDPFARKLVARYIERRKADLQTMRAALGGDDYDTIRITGHNMFGSGEAYGLREISSIGARLEQAATSRETERTVQLIDELEKYIANLAIA